MTRCSNTDAFLVQKHCMYLRLSLIAWKWDTDLSLCMGNVPAIHQHRLRWRRSLWSRGSKWITALCWSTCFSSQNECNTLNELDIDHTAVKVFESSACVCPFWIPPTALQPAMNEAKTSIKPVWRLICVSAIGCWPPLLNDGQGRLLLPHCKSSNRQMMTDGMNVINSRRRQEFPPEKQGELRWKNSRRI